LTRLTGNPIGCQPLVVKLLRDFCSFNPPKPKYDHT
jgi:hypothetical protein